MKKKIMKFLYQELIFRTKRFFHPKGILLVIMGPDGAGKSSVVDYVVENLQCYYPEKKSFHMRFNIFPTLKTGLGITTKNLNERDEQIGKTEKNNNKKSRSILSKVASWIVVIYYFFEFLVGNFLIFLEKRKNKLIVFDRYFYDYFVQPAYRDLIYSFRKIFINLVYKPDVVIFLEAKPEIIYGRKKELSIKEIAEQNSIFKKLSIENKNIYCVNTDKNTVEETGEAVIEIIYRINKKNKKFNGIKK